MCCQFAASGVDRFEGVDWRPATSGSPTLTDAIVWIDCDVFSETDAGDHQLILGAVRELEVVSDHEPLLFLRGGYRAVASDLTGPSPGH